MDLKKWIIPHLRRMHYLWPEAAQAWRDSRVSRGIYMCAKCQGLFKKKECQLDHIEPVIPIEGFQNFDVHLKRLFIKANGYQALCRPCHKLKTKEENNARH